MPPPAPQGTAGKMSEPPPPQPRKRGRPPGSKNKNSVLSGLSGSMIHPNRISQNSMLSMNRRASKMSVKQQEMLEKALLKAGGPGIDEF